MTKNTYTFNKKIQLIQCPDGKAGIRRKRKDGQQEDVHARIVRCFPWQHQSRFISIRDPKGKEVALLESLDQIDDAEIRNMLAMEMEAINYVPQILQIESIHDEAQLYNWKVVTTAGKRQFFMRRNESPRQLANEGLLMKDISGDRYFIKSLEDLDRESKDKLWIYLD
ncbi:MAG: DUF1854 domain-containing protein [Calditrichaeota bacterium]|nr:MAG: DUF1854 domain-containing protein [Calditrichota bacterium]